MFERRKDDATAFLERIQKSVGKYDLIYTRSAQGRPILLEARIKALGNKQERTITRKKSHVQLGMTISSKLTMTFYHDIINKQHCIGESYEIYTHFLRP